MFIGTLFQTVLMLSKSPSFPLCVLFKDDRRLSDRFLITKMFNMLDRVFEGWVNKIFFFNLNVAVDASSIIASILGDFFRFFGDFPTVSLPMERHQYQVKEKQLLERMSSLHIITSCKHFSLAYFIINPLPKYTQYGIISE